MKHQPDLWKTGTPIPAETASALPFPLDCETRAMLRLFLAPILENAQSWAEVADRLEARGYALGFCEGRMVVYNDLGQPLCTGSDIGIPMADLSVRLGRPCILAHSGGATGELRRARA